MQRFKTKLSSNFRLNRSKSFHSIW